MNYLRALESRIPNSDYGANKLKPFFGALFELDELVYVTQVSHPQPRHESMKNNYDFFKIYIPDRNPNSPDRLVAVVNLNYMFPVPKSLIKNLEYRQIEQYRTFKSNHDKTAYIDFLKKEMQAINTMNFEEKAKKVYFLKQNAPYHPVSKRCVDFLQLEEYAKNYLTK